MNLRVPPVEGELASYLGNADMSFAGSDGEAI